MSKDLEFLIKLVKDASLLITDDMHVKPNMIKEIWLLILIMQ